MGFLAALRILLPQSWTKQLGWGPFRTHEDHMLTDFDTPAPWDDLQRPAQYMRPGTVPRTSASIAHSLAVYRRNHLKEREIQDPGAQEALSRVRSFDSRITLDAEGRPSCLSSCSYDLGDELQDGSSALQPIPPSLLHYSSETTLCSRSQATLQPVPQLQFDEAPACWRLSEVRQILQSNNSREISHLIKFHPFNDEFVAAEIDDDDTRVDGPARIHTDWKPITTPMLTSSEILVAQFLERKSSQWFHQVLFTDWLHKALGLSPDSVVELCVQHQILSCRLRSHLRRYPEEFSKFVNVAEVLRDQSPFAHAAVAHACATVWTSGSLLLDCAFILDPLREFLCEPVPVSEIMQRLEVLSVRFRRLYHSADADLSQEFITDTTFLTSVRETEISHLAISRTRSDLTEFHKLDHAGVLSGDEHIQSLSVRWNTLCQLIEECAAVDELRSKLVELATQLSSLRNFFSASAVVQGLRGARIESPSLHELAYLVDAENNYELYRNRIDTKPSLHFLFPLVKAARLQDGKAVAMIFSFRRYYKVRKNHAGRWSAFVFR